MRDTLTMIPVSSLRRSKRNVRRTDRSAEIEALAASIDAHGLLQNLTVVEKPTANGAAYEVIAGGRRLEALRRLIRKKRLPEDFEAPCLVVTLEEASSAELSLAENILRCPLHPADQFEAFSKLQSEGRGPEEIAARFGVSRTVVLQRLRLAALSPKLIEAYRNDELTLDQLMAFAVTDDREAQERLWSEDPGRSPQAIRRELTRDFVGPDDRRLRFVGTKAYEEAGGAIVRDLFQDGDQGYVADVSLLDRMAAEKLSEAAREVQREGWAWVEVRPAVDYEYLGRFTHVPPETEERSAEERERLDALATEYDELVSDLEDDVPPDTAERLDLLEAEIQALSSPREVWSDEAKSRCGAVVAIGYDGGLNVVRGLLKPEDAPREAKPTKKKPKGGAGIPDGLREVLSAHRTAALRVELGRNPDTAFLALLHALVLRTFYPGIEESCIDIRPAQAALGGIADELRESPAVQAFAEDREKLSAGIPEPGALWSWLQARDREENLALLAHCTASCVNALWRKQASEQDRERQAGDLAQAIGLDMSRWWRATRLSYLDQVSKEGIMTAVSEGVSKRAAHKISHLKKGVMAARAEDLLAGAGWLPEPLRTPGQGTRVEE